MQKLTDLTDEQLENISDFDLLQLFCEDIVPDYKIKQVRNKYVLGNIRDGQFYPEFTGTAKEMQAFFSGMIFEQNLNS